MRERTSSVSWPGPVFEVALASLDCGGDMHVERVRARSEADARELARQRQEDPEGWCVVDVRSVVPTVARGPA